MGDDFPTQAILVGEERHQIFAISEHNFTNANLAGLLHHLAQQRVRLFRYRSIGSCIIRRVVECSRNFRAVYEANNINSFGGFDLYLGNIFRLDDRIAIRLILIAFGDLVPGDDLAAFFAALVVANWAVILAMQLIELNLFRSFDRVIDANRNSYQQKPYVAFPDGSHCCLSPGSAGAHRPGGRWARIMRPGAR